MQALRDNELAAGVIGVDTYRTKVIAFTLCAFPGGVGGGLFASGFTYISPDQFGFAESVVFLTMALLGRARSPLGVALGTVLLILLPEWLRFLKVTYLAVYGGAVILLMVILLMVFMPDGIWGFLETLRRSLWPPAVPSFGQVAPEVDSTILEVNQLSKHFGGLKSRIDSFDALSLAHGKPFRREEATRRDSGLVRGASNGQLDVTQASYGSASNALSKRQRVERARI